MDKGNLDASGWTVAQKDAIAEAFEQVRTDLPSQISLKSDLSDQTRKQVAEFVGKYFSDRIHELRLTPAGSGDSSG